MSVKFTIVDIFSTTPYKGNPLAVVEDLPGNLSDTQMKLIARQFNLSETTFFSQPTLLGATFRLRSFLPDGREVFGIGHNILGAWWFLAEGGFLDFSTSDMSKPDGTQEFTFYQELGGSLMPVKILRSAPNPTQCLKFSVSIQQAPPQAHAQHPDLASLARSIGLEAKDIGFSAVNQRDVNMIKPRVMSTATTYHLLVPVASAAALSQVTIQRDELLDQLGRVDERAYGIYLFTPREFQTETQTYQARFFSPGMSAEDPATGSAAGPLSAFLHKEGYLDLVNNEAYLEVSQGQQVGRECVIRVKLSTSALEDARELSVDVIGSGVKVAEGSIVVPEASISF
ncbi:Fc.00g103800.m01.CDS01 [Cosmosporella sp. VM-42]